MPQIASAGVGLDYEPILDVARGVAAGYRALPHAARASAKTPFGATDIADDRTGMFTTAVIVNALSDQRTRPPGTFVCLPLGASVAVTRPVRTALASFGDLSGVVLDLAGLTSVHDGRVLERALDQYRSDGAMIAIGGLGSAQSELSRMTRVRPAIMRLGRDWIRGAHLSNAKRSAVRAMTKIAVNLDAMVLAEGVTSSEELDVLRELGIELARGPLVGRPGEAWPSVSTTSIAEADRREAPNGDVLPVLTTS